MPPENERLMYKELIEKLLANATARQLRLIYRFVADLLR